MKYFTGLMIFIGLCVLFIIIYVAFMPYNVYSFSVASFLIIILAGVSYVIFKIHTGDKNKSLDQFYKGGESYFDHEKLVSYMVDKYTSILQEGGRMLDDDDKQELEEFKEKVSKLIIKIETISDLKIDHPPLANINYLMPLDKIKTTLTTQVKKIYDDHKVISHEDFQSIKDRFVHKSTDYLRLCGGNFIDAKNNDFKSSTGSEYSYRAPDYRIVTDNKDLSFSLELKFNDQSYIFVDLKGAMIYFQTVSGTPCAKELASDPFVKMVNFTDVNDEKASDNILMDEANKTYWFVDTEPKSFNLLKFLRTVYNPDKLVLLRENFLMNNNLNDADTISIAITAGV